MGKLNEGKSATGRTDYGTPGYVLQAIERMFGPVDLDAAASDEQHVCEAYLTDIEQPWPSTRQAYLNPPYGKGIGYFLTRARVAVLTGEAGCCICLVPARTSTEWWWDAVANPVVATSVWMIRGKIAFVGQEHQAMFPSALIVYGHPIKDPSPKRFRYFDTAMVDFRKKALRAG